MRSLTFAMQLLECLDDSRRTASLGLRRLRQTEWRLAGWRAKNSTGGALTRTTDDEDFKGNREDSSEDISRGSRMRSQEPTGSLVCRFSFQLGLHVQRLSLLATHSLRLGLSKELAD